MRCLAQPLRGSTTTKMASDSTTRPNRLHTHTHSPRRLGCTPALAHASFLDTNRTRNARPPTSPRSTGFCAIWGCISSSSSSKYQPHRCGCDWALLVGARSCFLEVVVSGLDYRVIVRNYSPGYKEQAPSRGHEASPQSTENMGRAACWCAQGSPRVAVRCSDLYEEGRMKHLAGPNAFWIEILEPTLKFLVPLCG